MRGCRVLTLSGRGFANRFGHSPISAVSTRTIIENEGAELLLAENYCSQILHDDASWKTRN